MIVSSEARVLFVHVQKTGGLTVEQLLLDALPGATRPPGGRHLPLQRILRDHPELADHWTFGFVRNPWARLWSWWSMIQRRGEVAAAGNAQVAATVRQSTFWSRALEYPDFETFVLQGAEEFPRLRRPQVDYLRCPEKSADFIGRTEHLADDLAVVWERLGLDRPAEVERRNAGPGTDYREQFSARARAHVARAFAPDVREFGYEF